jgi:hypothetical protein
MRSLPVQAQRALEVLHQVECNQVVLLEMQDKSCLWLPAISSCLDVSMVLLEKQTAATSSHVANWLQQQLSFALQPPRLGYVMLQEAYKQLHTS